VPAVHSRNGAGSSPAPSTRRPPLFLRCINGEKAPALGRPGPVPWEPRRCSPRLWGTRPG